MQRTATNKPGGLLSRFRFIVDTFAELKKVVWLSRREAGYLTLLVIIVSAVAGVALGLVDLGFSRLIEVILSA